MKSSLLPVTANSFLKVTSFLVDVFRDLMFCEEKFNPIILFLFIGAFFVASAAAGFAPAFLLRVFFFFEKAGAKKQRLF